MRRFIPRYFEKDISTGVPSLTPEGRKAIQQELAESSLYSLESYDEQARKSEGVTIAEEIVGS